ncbi:MAG: DNA topoisomerase, partial [Lachnospiraceae bacterium]|nr:DNA topoisomerase [Lachnospiraceae bacterium]
MSEPKEQIVQLDFAEEMKTSFRDYALSVILARALPDVRDGLKPVQRRILYAMNELGLDPKKPHRKSARIVGDTMGKYHPHGDSSIYDALVHMTEDYSLSVPLVDGHGNFGSIDGDGAAAMRYTEARLSDGAMTMLENLDKGLVDFMPNFDESEKEPKVLPAMLPNLLINGTTGIAVGMATNIPPHNPGEVIDGVIAYLDNPDITEEKLLKYIPGPDFPTGGIITNTDVLPEIYRTGEGKIRVRARTEIENGEAGRKNIVVTEIPYTIAGNKLKLVENLVSLMKDKSFEEIYDVRDESSKEGIRIVIEVKKDRDPENLLNGLLKKTCMEDTYTVNLLAVKDKQPIVFSLKSLVKEFADFQEILYTKEHEYLLNKAEARQEIVNGLLRATDVIDLIIEILRGSSSVKQAKDCLISGITTDIRFKNPGSEQQAKTLNFTERQADAILAMPLSKLIGLE